MATILRGIDNIDSANIATDTELTLKANTIDLKEIGVNQTWQYVTSSRSAGVTYTNSTGKPIQVIVRSNTNDAGFVGLNLSIDGIVVNSVRINTPDTNSERLEVNAIVPNGSTYLVDATYGTIAWLELR